MMRHTAATNPAADPEARKRVEAEEASKNTEEEEEDGPETVPKTAAAAGTLARHLTNITDSWTQPNIRHVEEDEEEEDMTLCSFAKSGVVVLQDRFARYFSWKLCQIFFDQVQRFLFCCVALVFFFFFSQNPTVQIWPLGKRHLATLKVLGR